MISIELTLITFFPTYAIGLWVCELNQVYGSVIILPSRVLFHQLLQSFYQLVDHRVVAVFDVADDTGSDMAGYQSLLNELTAALTAAD